MSGSDIRDILQLGKTNETTVRRFKQSTEKRPEGFSRELYSLIGGAPPVAFVQPTYKAKYNVKKKAVPWVLQPFANPARAGDLILQHWVKASDATNEGNLKMIKMYYPEWTKEETEYLFSLCRQYDLRFPIIEDRYDLPKPRTMEDLKDRYYSVSRKLFKERPALDNNTDRQTLIQQYSFDKSKEVERKQALIILSNRTKEQMDEEEALLVEARRIELNEARLGKEREGLLNMLQLEQLQQVPSTPGTPTTHSALNGGSLGSTPGGIGITGGTASAASGSDVKVGDTNDVKQNIKKGLNDVQKKKKKIVPEKKEKLTPGVYVRSQKLPTVKPTMQQKVLKVMEELAIGARPVMPTAQVCHKFEQLQNSILNMFELKKVVDKMEMEHKMKTQRSRDGTPAVVNRDGANRVSLALITIHNSQKTNHLYVNKETVFQYCRPIVCPS
ncbi:Homeodomain-like DNA binding domain-containing transcription factor [Phycomyces blakesleeanus NRRL 1555(-)]|uniref:SWR1-complex protein 4 n=1 Tax=Phycomyces blakesleeanus (strain ATCC 8743b / DSM 1359 / FGSC 10004 / NBRC 33097 / NRRL 1555) TaxID=763407 RepID=A0A167PPP5_PHYB8|nr:Homeodomain-like DNA binding domain-containing transcription factor [Phycomyces blakesleeanus NRRL 1555(-)]OAD78316.1 Homeodomain-like DNA binding domain-containing transcription factor [Phycomyces blakesleeanus NRRL 1555(-)]|eukprot:XP_018296356.1 Homeodomain-like DNA binding domain-containing transcription factor [Phycomyces blakesleeanus NRRL 1555(-)]